MNRRLRTWLSPLVPQRIVLPWLMFWKGPRRGLAGRWGWARSLRDKSALGEAAEPLPWMPYAAIALLAERLAPEHTVLEFGAGHSTLFFAARTRRVVAVEHDASWIEWTRARAPGNVQIVSVPREPAHAYCAAAGRDGPFDVIVVDGVHRIEALAAALPLLSARGVILLDDSHRARYAPALATAAGAGLRHLHLEGHKPMSVDVHRATLFYRDGNCFGI